ncbi:metastasis-associated protein MTA3 [Copidosoma floridanum]|uniref:metastasis-associated protein MTA3 n=1 Tax=Copidosoma floridanum TaxID=29053 RepID=UPI000C6F5937|nr:metastasis-associated protein MTA3 [Copidosoma floridanum]
MPMPAEYHENANFALGAYQDTSNMTANMYRVGDYVYFETSSSSPYQIRRIEELNKTASGNVEAKVMCFFRRRDLPAPLIVLADKHQLASAAELQQRSESPGYPSHPSPENCGAKDMSASAAAAPSATLVGNLAPRFALNKAASSGKGPWLKATLAQAHEPYGMEDGTSVLSGGGMAISGGGGGGGGCTGAVGGGNGSGPIPNLGPGIGGVSELTTKQRHQMKHRELFLSRQVETMPATHIRGKCCVTLLNETESLLSYLNKDDSFFYCLVFDPTQRTLLADKGEIRVGTKYQADNIAPVPLTPAERDSDPRRLEELEQLVWKPQHKLTDRQIDQFLVISRSVGTFARALDCSSSVKQPSLHMSAAAASRDVTLFHAMDTLHKHDYDLEKAMSSLVPGSGPVLCRDEMEEWSASEANLFEEALEKYGKDFSDIRHDFLPWKSLKNVIEYYYMWKTTDRYVQQKRVKAVEAESKLKQVYIPNYSKNAGPAGPGAAPVGLIAGQASIIPLGTPNNASNGAKAGAAVSILNGSSNGAEAAAMLMASTIGKPCESCQTMQSPQWYPWGPLNAQCRLCQSCWNYWKKYGGLKVPSRIDEVDADRKRNSAGSDEESKGASGSHKPYRCNVASCGKDFKLKAHLTRHYVGTHGLEVRSNTGPAGAAAGVGVGVGLGSPRPVMKTRSAFYLRTSTIARAARRLCAAQLRTRHAARAPHQLMNVAPLRMLINSPQLSSKSQAELRILARASRPRPRPRVTDIATRLGNLSQPRQPGDWDWLLLTAPAMRKQPDRVSFPRPPKAPDGSLLYERVPNKSDVERLPATPPVQPTLQPQQNLLKRTRPLFDEVNGADGVGLNAIASGQPPLKRAQHGAQSATLHGNARTPGLDHVASVASPAVAAAAVAASVLPPHVAPLNGRASLPHALSAQGPMSRSNARKQLMSWMDAPDDVYFRSTEHIKRMRKTMPSLDLRRAARKPWRRLSIPPRVAAAAAAAAVAQRAEDMVVILD